MTQRMEARMAGCSYLVYIVVAMSSSVLYGRATAGENVSQTLSTLSRAIWTARVSVLLDLVGPVCALVLAVTLYRLARTVDPTLALLAMLFRVGEGLLGCLPVLGKLELMRLATTPSIDPANGLGLSLANEALHRPDGGFSEFCFVMGGSLFAVLLLRGRLIPRGLAWIGVAAIGAQAICVPLHIATIIPSSIVNWLWLPVLFYEIPLGIWLIAKGTSGHGISTEPKTFENNA